MSREKQFYLALAAYAVLALSATFTLDGKFRALVLIVLGGLAVRTWVAFKTERQG